MSFIKELLVMMQDGKISKENLQTIIGFYQQHHKQYTDIAVIGIGCQFPQAKNKEQFWLNLKNGVCSVGDFPQSRRKDTDHLLIQEVLNTAQPYCPGGYLQNIDLFDPGFFGLTMDEAASMDPQHRLFLQTVNDALEDAGYGAERIRNNNVGVYVGNSENEYHHFLDVVNIETVTGNASPFLCSRISFLYNFKGPCMMVNTACSSSLVAVHLACQALANQECEMAIAGGVSLFLLPVNQEHETWGAIGISSSTGFCKPFDDSASGIVRGEGSGVVLLKPLSKAMEDKDHIYAVIKGSSVNQDGHSNGITSPNPLAQAALLEQTWKKAGVDVSSIEMFEAHGTGTKLGDPVEISGLNMAFKKHTNRKQFCAIGSVKSNIGHLSDGAAGISSLIKVILSIENEKIPPTLHFEYPNSLINFLDTPVYVNTKVRNWLSTHEHWAAVSSFGLSGTNCHMILHKHKTKEKQEWWNEEVFVASAKTERSLQLLLGNCVEFLSENLNVFMPDFAYTMAIGRGHYTYRVAILFSSREDLIAKIKLVLKNVGADEAKSLARQNIYCGKMDDCQRLAPSCIKDNIDLARSYVLGASISWSDVYSKETHRTISAPTYAYDNIRCWYEKGKNEKITNKTNISFTIDSSASDEEMLISICANVLGINPDSISLEDDFFSLGGNSMKILDLIRYVYDIFAVELDLATIFRKPALCEILNEIIHNQRGGSEIATRQDKVFPLTPAQKRIYYLDNLYKNTLVNNLTGCIEIDGDFNREKFEGVVYALIERHSVFKVSIGLVDRKPVLLQNDEVDFVIEYTKTDGDIKSELAEFVKPFALDVAPLLRVGVLEVSRKQHYVIFDMNHLISDGTSLGLLVKDFVRLYNGEALEHLKTTFRDYSFWLEERQAAVSEKQKKFWLEQFEKEPPHLSLPYDFTFGSRTNYIGSTYTGYINGATLEQLSTYCKKNNITLFTALLAAFYILLFEYTGQQDIVIGIMTSGRNHPYVKDIVGMFVNTLALRAFPQKDKNIKGFIYEIVDIMMQAFENQEYQYNDLIRSLRKKYGRNDIDLVSVAFAMQNMEYPEFKLKDVTVTQHLIDNHVSQFDLRLEVWNFTKSELKLNFEYKTACFKKQTIENMMISYKEIVETMVHKDTMSLKRFQGKEKSINFRL